MDDAPGELRIRVGGGEPFLHTLGSLFRLCPEWFLCSDEREKRKKGVWGGGMCKWSQSSIFVRQPSYKILGKTGVLWLSSEVKMISVK